MWKLKETSQFRKDFKRFLNKPDKLKALQTVLDSLEASGTVPPEYFPHPLSGNWANHMECHVKGDFLLIWYDKAADIIKLVRLGSHSEL